jgi:putative hydrolase of the HAD superfamily
MARGSSVSQKRYLLWDFGNTLAEFPDGWSDTALKTLQAAGYDASLEFIRAQFSSGFPWHAPESGHAHLQTSDDWWRELLFPVFRRVVSQLGIPQTEHESLCASFRAACLQPHAWQVYPDVHSTLETLSTLGWTHIIVSNQFPELETLLEGMGLRHHFEQVFTSGIVGFEKPNPKFFEFMLERLEPAKTMWMIGDNHAHDIVGAAQFGIPGILIGKPRAGVEHSCVDLGGVIEILAQARAA